MISMVLKLGSKQIYGESECEKHKKEIDVLEWSWGLTQSASGHHGKGAGSGSADVRDLTIKKFVDASSPILIQECFKGSNHGEAILTVLKAGGAAPVEMVKMTMTGTVFISSVSTGHPTPDDRYTETVTLNFSKVKFEYTPQGEDQAKGAAIAGEFDIAARH
jgi:type VI secretion system secreted protein Hcp